MTFHRIGLLERFACLGADCVDTCCKGWHMQVDPVRLERYRHEKPELMETVTEASAEIATNTTHIMKHDPATGYCQQFTADRLCRIHRDEGTDYLGDACHFYPRITRALGAARFMTATLSCPEIARLALIEGAPLTYDAVQAPDRLPVTVTDYTPDGLSPAQARSVADAFLAMAVADSGEEAQAPVEPVLARIVSVARSLQHLPATSWPDAAPFYLRTAAARLPAGEYDAADPFRLMTALAGMIVTAPPASQPRARRVIAIMEEALQVKMGWKSLQLLHSSNDPQAYYAELAEKWQKSSDTGMRLLLRRWLAAQLSMTFFPFSGLGHTPLERATILAVRFATLRLALMCACELEGGVPSDETILLVVQGVSRVCDHLADPAFCLAIYDEVGWLREARLQGLIAA